MFKRAFAKWVVDQSLPLSIGQSESFKDVLKVANKAICAPNNTELKIYTTFEKGGDYRKIEKIHSRKYLFFKVKHWTSLANENYSTLTLHLINDVKPMPMLFCSKHEDGAMAEEMEGQLTSDLQSWGLNADFCVALVSDSTSDMNALGRMITEKYPTKHHYTVLIIH